MTCDQAQKLLHGYLDDELDLASALEMESHLATCTECQAQAEASRAVRKAVSQSAVYYRASSVLRDRVRSAIQNESSTRATPSAAKSSWWMRYAIAAAILLLIGSVVLFLPRNPPRGQIAELVDSHVRSLQANHLLDVESTDQHTVKPWFAGKIDFSPPVVDLSAEGFPLVGGRLDDIDQHKAAAVVYRRNKHLINLFIWPGDSTPATDSIQGFNLIRFECKGMTCWAVSDLNEAELRQFIDLFSAQKPASTRF